MVRSEEYEKELRLRRLFFEAVVIKDAKMTCSTNLLNLFMNKNEMVQKKLLNVYFPVLFYLSNSFPLFINEFHYQRFKILCNWFAKNRILTDEETKLPSIFTLDLSPQQIDSFIFEFYSFKSTNDDKFTINFDQSLKEMSRNTFMKIFTRQNGNNFRFINSVSDSAREFIFYFNEIKSLFF